MIPEDLDNLAKRVIDEFTSVKRVAYPNYSVNTRRHGLKMWRKVARRILDFQYDPVMYVRAVVHAYSATAYPNMLMTADHADIYRAYTSIDNAHNIDVVRNELSRQASYIGLRTQQGQALEDILVDPANSFDSLFVWCMATANGMPELARRYEDKARDYLLRPIYREIYAKKFNTIDFGGITR